MAKHIDSTGTLRDLETRLKFREIPVGIRYSGSIYGNDRPDINVTTILNGVHGDLHGRQFLLDVSGYDFGIIEVSTAVDSSTLKTTCKLNPSRGSWPLSARNMVFFEERSRVNATHESVAMEGWVKNDTGSHFDASSAISLRAITENESGLIVTAFRRGARREQIVEQCRNLADIDALIARCVRDLYNQIDTPGS